MKLKTARLLALVLTTALASQVFLPVASLSAQDPQTPSHNQTQLTIPDGTEFTVLTTEEISSKTASENDPVNLKVADDVKINDRVVISKGTLVKGIVASVEQKGHLGKGGKLGLRVESTTAVDGQKIRLRASKGKGDTGTVGSTIALSLLISPLFLLRRGKDAVMKPGTRIKVFTDEDKNIRIPE